MQAPTRSRILSIDILRGLTIALMILVNDPGDWSHVFSQLDHAAWNGFTLTDFVFPNFLFLVGVSIVLSLEARIAQGNCRLTLALRLLRRVGLIIALDLALTLLPHMHYHRLRLFGVLTRIALCSLAAGLLCIWTRRPRTLALTAAALLVGYWALMRFVPVPGFGVPTHTIPLLDPDRNLTAYLDRGFTAFTQRWLQTGRLYEGTRDPEGLLSTLPAIATTLLGCLTALWIRRPRLDSWIADHFRAYMTTAGLAFGGAISLAAGLLWSIIFPLNKKLWTSSYVLVAAGISLLCLALVYLLVEVRRLNETRPGRILTFPWLVFGSNAITAYVASVILEKTLSEIHTSTPPDHPANLLGWLYHHLFAFNGSTKLTSLAFAIAFTAACFLPNILLWRRRIFFKL